MAPSIQASPADLIQYAQRGLSRAAVDARHPWRLPVLITRQSHGRVVVLRSVDIEEGSWIFYTDQRSPKVQQLEASNYAAGATFYHPKEKSQLRMNGKVSLLSDEQHQMIWTTLSNAQKSSYAAAQPPGSQIKVGGTGLSKNWDAGNPTPQEEDFAFQNFVCCRFQLQEVDLLILHREGHRRCAWQGWQGKAFRWLVP